MNAESEAGPAGAASELVKARSKFADLLHWSPAALLLLYVLGYIAANSHYSRFEMVKPTLLTGRYLSAGLLYTAFIAVPAAVGFRAVHHVATRRKADVKILYPIFIFLYTFVLGYATMIEPLRWAPWSIIASATAIGVSACLGFLHGEQVVDRQVRAAYRVSKLARHGILMIAVAYPFGTAIYPWVKPHFGGAAVREGYVVLKPSTPEQLSHLIGRESLPFFDLDDKFLYVITCWGGAKKPEVIMVPLEFLAVAGLESTPDRFFAVPAYIDQHQCTRIDTENGTP